jgi:hypothetical protein
MVLRDAGAEVVGGIFTAQVAALLLYFVGYASICDSSGGWDWDEDVRG